MNSIIELVFELAGGVILLLAAGYTFAQISGYGEFYDKILYDDKGDIDLQISGDIDSHNKMQSDNNTSNDLRTINNNDNNNSIIHYVSI